MVLIGNNLFSIDRFLFDSYSTSHGLSHGTVNDIIQDDDGFMWFCTDDGINRYDGYNFKQYVPIKENQPEKNNIQCKCVIKDSEGWLWFGTSTGLYYYNPQTDQIIYFRDKTNIESSIMQLESLVNALLIDKEQNLWVGSYDGLISFDLLKAKDSTVLSRSDITIYANDKNEQGLLSDHHIFSIYQDKNEIIWFSTFSNYIDSYNPETNSFQSFKIDHPGIICTSNVYKQFIVDERENFYIFTEGIGVFFWDKTKNEFSEFELFDGHGKKITKGIVRDMLFDKNNCLWIGTDGYGILIKEEDRFEQFKVDENNFSNLNSNAIYNLYEDRDHNIWIGTYLAGINKLAYNKANFGLFTSAAGSGNSLKGNLIFNFLEDHEGHIWIATDGNGLNKLNTKDYTFEHYYPDPNKKDWISTAATIALWQDRNLDIWIGSYNGGLNKYSFETNSFQTFYHDPNDSTSLSCNHPWAFEEDQWGNLWIATVNAGLNLKKPNSNQFIHYGYSNELETEDYLISDGLTDLYIDSRNYLWIATEAGLDVIDLNKVDFHEQKPALKFKHYQYVNTQNSISSNNVSYVTENHKGDMLIGTRVAGLNILDVHTDSIIVIKEEDGLPHNMIHGIIEDDNHNVWLSTGNGIAVLDSSFNVIASFKAEDGLQDNAFIKTSCLKASDGKMYFGGVKGFNAFYPDVLNKNSTIPPVKITDFNLFNRKINVGEEVDNRIILPVAIHQLDLLELEHRNNFISFQFTALDYTNPQKNQYAFILDGFDKDWRYVSSQNRNATYTNVNPGKYTFKVKASNNDGVWNEEGTSLKVIVLPPWWETWWARTLFVLLILGAIALFIYLRLKRVNDQKKLLIDTVKQRTKQLQKANSELKDLNTQKDKLVSIISHDVLSPFNAIIGFSDLLVSSYKTLDEKELELICKQIYHSSNRLHRLLANLLQWSKSERGALSYNPKKLNVNIIISETIAMLQYAAQEKEIELSTDTFSDKVLVYSDQLMVETIIRNLVSNALKFTPNKGAVVIKVERVNTFVHISIIDNGVGISVENQKRILSPNDFVTTAGTNQEKGTGLGLKIVTEFVAKQGGELWISCEEGEGTKFTFSVPAYKKGGK